MIAGELEAKEEVYSAVLSNFDINFDVNLDDLKIEYYAGTYILRFELLGKEYAPEIDFYYPLDKGLVLNEQELCAYILSYLKSWPEVNTVITIIEVTLNVDFEDFINGLISE